MAKASFEDILQKLDMIQRRLDDIDTLLENKFDEAENRITKKKRLKAKDIPIGAKVRIDNLLCEVIAYSKYGDEMIVVEDEGGVTWENANDVEVVEVP